jgi:hypothetical protein
LDRKSATVGRPRWQPAWPERTAHHGRIVASVCDPEKWWREAVAAGHGLEGEKED